MDWAATVLAATGTAQHHDYPFDGEDLLPVCRGAVPPRDRTLFWRTRERAAARVGRWKYLREPGGEHLFDLSVDPGEKADLRHSRRDVFERLQAAYGEWNARMLPLP
jgi:arylsulfatase A-like enzyme